MIYTVTLNPSLDYIMQIGDLKIGAVNRTEKEKIGIGGKGVNVSIILKVLGVPNRALGFVGGFTGQQIIKTLEAYGIENDFIDIEEGVSRINIKIRSDKETEINGSGPNISEGHIKALNQKIQNLQKGDFLVLAGSIPGSMPPDTYRQIMESMREKEINVVVDATKELLLDALEYKPFLIKPNQYELGELFNTVISNHDEAISYGKKLQEKGARNVLVSMGKDGAVLIAENGQTLKHRGISGKVKYTVGAGDSMVAGFIAGYTKQQSMVQAFTLGVSAGSATAFSEDLATKEEIECLMTTF